MTLERLIRELKFTPETEEQTVREICRNPEKIKKLAETAYEGEDFQFLLCKALPLERLAAVVWLLRSAYDRYQAKKIPDTIIFDTFRDVSLRAGLYCQRTGQCGISAEDVIWFRHIRNAVIFKIGVLQFQRFEMLYPESLGEDVVTLQNGIKEELPEGTPVINIHIQKGTDLQESRVETSLENAAEFFQNYFPETDYRAFLCCSWLLYPPMTKCLPPDSRIRKFADRFTIIGTSTYREQATENLYAENGKKGQTEKRTFLQKLAVSEPEKFGFALGLWTDRERKEENV